MRAYILEVNTSKKFQPANYVSLCIVDAKNKQEAKELVKKGEWRERFTSTDHISNVTIEASRVRIYNPNF